MKKNPGRHMCMFPEVSTRGGRVEDVGHGVVDEGLDGGLGRGTEMCTSLVV